MHERFTLRKRLAIEPLVEARDRQADEIGAAPGRHRRVLGVGAEVLDVLDEDRNDLALVAHQQARQRRGLGGTRAFERRQRPFLARVAAQRMADRLLEALAVERLEQVVDRVQLEGGDRVLVVGGGEDDGRPGDRRIGAEGAQHLEAGHPRHVDVHQDERRRELADRLQRADAVGAGADQLEHRHLVHPRAERFARERFVFGNEGPVAHGPDR